MRFPAIDPAHALAWLEEVERTWLGWSLPPTGRALADAGWEPDEPAAYCGRCGGSIGPGEVTPSGCAACRGRMPATDAVVRLGDYSGALREWVRAIKYRGWAEMAEALGRRLGRAVAERGGASGDCGEGGTIVVPMPMPWQRRLYRGIDHARVIAVAVAAELGAEPLPMLVQRNGPPQVRLGLTVRARRGSRIRLRRRYRRADLEGCRIVLVDDVRTSGASLDAAARQLRRLTRARILAAVLAVTDPPTRRVTVPAPGPPGPPAGRSIPRDPQAAQVDGRPA